MNESDGITLAPTAQGTISAALATLTTASVESALREIGRVRTFFKPPIDAVQAGFLWKHWRGPQVPEATRVKEQHRNRLA